MNRAYKLGAACLPILLAGSCAFIQEGKGHQVVAYFEDAGDLVEAGTVQVNDVEIGTVDNIDLVMQNGRMVARVEISVNESENVPATNLRALV